MGLPIVQVDAFTAVPFKGNPAAVCVVEREPAEDWMQAVAAEMNLAETVFLRRREARVYDIRWFTQRLGKNELVGQQVSQRGGVVKVRVLGDRVDLLGQAVTVLRGELVL